MAHYTVTIKSLIDNNFDFKLTNYPIFDENYRETLNNNILNHFYENEIGFETAALFRFYLNQRLNEIMPFYNILYEKQKTLLENFDYNVNLTEELKRTNNTDTTSNSSSNSNSNSSSNNKNLFQNTPQGQISSTEIDEQKWATNVTFDKNQNTSSINDNSNSSGNANTTENYIKNIVGNNGKLYGFEIFNAIKDNLMNIDLLIINDLNDLFMGIF